MLNALVLVAALTAQSSAPSDLTIWTEFVSLLRSGRITETHIRPAYASPQTMLQFLSVIREGANWDEWAHPPEIHRVGDRVHFVAALSERGVPNTYSFTFITENGRWLLEHFEGIVVRLDRLGAPPVSAFPDLSEEKKAWMRQEKHWSEVVRLYRIIRDASGTKAALDALRDGPGYLVEARTWVPFYPPEKAFVVYLCWEQSRLQGNPVTLERLDDSAAVVWVDSVYLRLYKQSAHMRELVPEAEYRAIFETTWRDRAAAAGWEVEFTYDGSACTMRFARKTQE